MNTAFLNDVWEQVRAIPRGTVSTYGHIGALAGYPRAWRAAAKAIASAPGDVPCHRVVRSDGSLALYAFPEQRALLEGEGVGFLQSGRVDMRTYRWRPNWRK